MSYIYIINDEQTMKTPGTNKQMMNKRKTDRQKKMSRRKNMEERKNEKERVNRPKKIYYLTKKTKRKQQGMNVRIYDVW